MDQDDVRRWNSDRACGVTEVFRVVRALARRTLWDDDQLKRRLNRKVLLPEAHSEDDLLEIAKARHPEGSKASWKLLMGYAMAAAKKQASAITEALESAADIAQQQGRDSIT